MIHSTNTHDTNIITLDLKFLGFSGAIAAYLIPHSSGAALVECGPGSTLEALQAGLAAHGFTLKDISDVFLTHIHLDHAGACGRLASHGARIHVHPVGAPHLRDPEKLLSSAKRIYGDQMERLWGEFLPVPEKQLSVLQAGDIVELNGLRAQAIDTPGHADHHFVYLIDGVCFSGDIGGVRLAGLPQVRLPMPPPEFHLEKWRDSLERLAKLDIRRIAPTHFGIFDDAAWHLSALFRELDTVQAWIGAILPADPDLDKLTGQFQDWMKRRSAEEGIRPDQTNVFEITNPSWMSPLGIQRYWRKHRSS
jgi:glyoxylase-like metal-dependent hydrolase (beta-lactamase superfamily II)